MTALKRSELDSATGTITHGTTSAFAAEASAPWLFWKNGNLADYPTTPTLVTDFTNFHAGTYDACDKKLILNTTSVFVDGYTHIVKWTTPGTTATESIPLTDIFTDTSGSCPIVGCNLLGPRHDIVTYPGLNHRDFYTKVTTTTNIAVTTTTMDVTMSAVGVTPFFAMECSNSVNWRFSPYFKVIVIEHPCVATTINPVLPVNEIKLWIDLYVDWELNETPQPVPAFSINVDPLSINSNPSECPTQSITLTSVKQLAAVVDPSVYSSVLTYNADTKEMTIANYGAIEVPAFTGLQIFYTATQELKTFEKQYFELSIDYNLCRNMTITYSKPPFEIELDYTST